MGPYVLCHMEGALESSIEASSCMAMFECQLIGLLELTKNLCFPQDHRIHATSDTQKMMHTLRFHQPVNLIGQGLVVLVALQEKILQRPECLRRFKVRRSVNFDSITSR